MILQAGQGSRKGWLASYKSGTNGAPKTDGKFHHFQVNLVAFCLAYGGGLESCGSLIFTSASSRQNPVISVKKWDFSANPSLFSPNKKNEKYDQHLQI